MKDVGNVGNNIFLKSKVARNETIKKLPSYFVFSLFKQNTKYTPGALQNNNF